MTTGVGQGRTRHSDHVVAVVETSERRQVLTVRSSGRYLSGRASRDVVGLSLRPVRCLGSESNQVFTLQLGYVVVCFIVDVLVGSTSQSGSSGVLEERLPLVSQRVGDSLAATVTAHGGGEHLVGVHGLTGELRVSSADRQRGIIRCVGRGDCRRSQSKYGGNRRSGSENPFHQ